MFEALTRCARSSEQRQQIYDMLHGSIYNPQYTVIGRPKRFSFKYGIAFRGLIQRIRDAGFTVNVELNPRSGFAKARYSIKLAQSEM